jgi:lipoate-protein ligase B
VPCGIAGHGVTSLVDLGLPVTMGDLDDALRATFGRAFGRAFRAVPGAVPGGAAPGAASTG